MATAKKALLIEYELEFLEKQLQELSIKLNITK